MKNKSYKTHSLWLRFFLRKMWDVLTHPHYIYFYSKYYLKRFYMIKTNKFDAYMISYPKSGCTWLEMLIEKCHKPTPNIVHSHGGGNWSSEMIDENQIKNYHTRKFSNNKVIFIYRDPRDVLVSAYHHIKYRDNYQKLTKEEMIYSPFIGFKKIINFMNHWHDFYKKNPSACFLLSYEDLKQNTEKQITRIYDFMGINHNSSQVERGILSCSFKNMQKQERGEEKIKTKDSPIDASPFVKAKNKKNINSFKTRKGQVGEHKTFFSKEQLAYLNDELKQLNPAFGYTHEKNQETS